MEYFRVKYMSYGFKAHSREHAMKQATEFIKKIGPEAFVVDAEKVSPKRGVLSRLVFGG
jgi:hypothetical protein